MRFELTTKVSPEQVQRAMTDFTDRRLEIWRKTLGPMAYEVHEGSVTPGQWPASDRLGCRSGWSSTTTGQIRG